MSTERSDIIVRVGTGSYDAASARVGVDEDQPYIEWDTPSNILQVRWSIRISCVEPGATAFTTSGPRTGSDQSFRVPVGLSLNQNFEGLCKAEVALSSSGSGDFEYISKPVYFVYDRNLERFFNATKLSVSWQASPDPDQLPVGLGRSFHLQIATDPLFTEIAYENTSITDVYSAVVIYDIPDAYLTLVTGKTYFWRVRESDGMDFGDWSKTNAFANYDNAPPVVQITAVRELKNDDGDVEIDLTVTDVNGDHCSVELMVFGGPITEDPLPLSLAGPTLTMSPGSYTVRWRSYRQLGAKAWGDIVLTAKARDNSNYGPEYPYGPLTIDNTHIKPPAGGIGNKDFTFAIAGHMAVSGHVETITLSEPVAGKLAVNKTTLYEYLPVAPGIYAWQGVLSIGALEKHEDGGSGNHGGWGEDGTLDWPRIILRSSGVELYTGDLVGAGRIAPSTSETSFLFESPVAYTQAADGYPKSYSSRMLNHNRFLRGYRTAAGDTIEYPNYYDWANRPAWHQGNEVWGTGDAWVQLWRIERTEFQPCGTCAGKTWVIGSSGPEGSKTYFRNDCPDCTDGFDHTKPYVVGSKGRHQTKVYIDVDWVRLRTFTAGSRPREITGLRAEMPATARAAQHIAGNGLSTLDGVYHWEEHDGKLSRVLDYYLIETRQGLRRIDKQLVVEHPVTGNDNRVLVTRQLDGGTATGAEVELFPIEWHTMQTHYTGLGGVTVMPLKTSLTQATQGFLGKPAHKFFTGTIPTDHPAYAARSAATQRGGLAVDCSIGRNWQTVPLSFVFTQAYWDAYNTIHWEMTGSETTRNHIQVCRVFEDRSRSEWIDVQGDNATFDTNAKAWMTNPLVFHLFWNTANRASYPSGGTYQLRLRLFDTTAKKPTFGQWVYSREFQIIDGVTNPASIVSTDYDRWSKRITMQVRVDDNDFDNYTLTGFWYSTDNGQTWLTISGGDISGDTHALSSRPGENVHTVYWNSAPYSLPATNECRIRIECVPTNSLETLQIPLFKWLAPVNPYLDDAESNLTDIMGRWEHRVYNDETQQFEPANPPRRVPGRLTLLQQQVEDVRQHATTAAPAGAYSFMTPDAEGAILGKVYDKVTGGRRWNITNQAGYDAWLKESYGIETHGQALSRLAGEINYLVSQQIPSLRATISAAETRCRKNLMRQGFFAEEHFDEPGGEVSETFTLPATGQNDVNAPNMVTRWWRFRVQAQADGPTDIYDTDGNYNPKDLTPLELVRYKWEMDFRSDFASQPHGNPLRNRTTNYDGKPLTASASQTSTPMTNTNPVIDSTRPPAATTGSQAKVVQIGSVLKLSPDQLPGKLQADALPAGVTSFEAEYQWRVSAYNAVVAPISARPRVRITRYTEDAVNGAVFLDYLAQAHDRITTISHSHNTDQWGRKYSTGYQVSYQMTAPAWVDHPLTWISDRRAPNTENNPSRQVNSLEWTWPGTDRRRASMSYDTEQQQYVGVCFKKNPNDLTGNTFRIVGFRANEREKPCEFEVYFKDRSELRIYAPSFVKVGGTYYLFMAVQSDAVTAPAIYVSTSSDADAWSDPVPTSIDAGGCPSVVHDGTRFHLFFETPAGASVQVFHATSDNGIAFNAPAQVTSEPLGAGHPGAIYRNGAFALYYVSGTEIVSVAGTDPNVLIGRQVELTNTAGTTFLYPMPMVDLHYGNDELFLSYTAKNTTTGACQTRLARMENRLWINGVTDKLYAASGHLFDVECSRDGVARRCTLDLYSHNIPVGSPVKVRMNFNEWSPMDTEYQRQSDWVSVANMEETGANLEPKSFTYSRLLESYPYMKS